MPYGQNFAANGRPLPATFHIPATLANFPYVPHPLMLAGVMPPAPVMGAVVQSTGPTVSSNFMRLLNLASRRPK